MGGQHKNIRPDNGKIIIQQYNFKSRGTLHVLLHQEFYLGTPVEKYEYIRLTLNIILEEIIEQYNLKSMEKNGYVYADTIKGMYVLPQVGQI